MLNAITTALGNLLAGLRSRWSPTESDHTGHRRETAERDGDLVVFVVGMRINAFWKVHRWLPVFLVAPRIVRELRASDAGLLGNWTFLSPPRTVGFVQYWDSFESLREYAHDEEGIHRDAWRDYYRNRDDGAVGIWHETYRVDAAETVYNNTPPRGLGAADGSDRLPATGSRDTAAGRLVDEVEDRPVHEESESAVG